MGRRKKEPKSAHREAIATAAQVLFMSKGVDMTTMDDIAREAGYSKATLYVYFENKEEIVGMLVLDSMIKLYEHLTCAWEQQNTTREKYNLLCRGLVRYQERLPYYFKIVLKKINVDFDNISGIPEDKETYHVGEKINDKLRQILMEGIATGEIRQDIDIMSTIFTFWGMLAGFIQLAADKEIYIARTMGLQKQEFLEQGFETLYRSIEKCR